jgi:hypothetical protein
MASKKMDLLTGMSAAELRRLAKTKERLDGLEGKRAVLAKDLAQVDKEIAKLLSSLTGRKPARKKAGRKKVGKKTAKKRAAKVVPKKKVQVGKKKAAKKRVAKKTGAKKAPRVTVESVVVALLKGRKKPMAFQDILATIEKKKLVTSKSKNFANVLRRTLSTSKKIKRVARGMYGV